MGMAVMLHTRRRSRRTLGHDVFADRPLRVSSGTVSAGGRAVRAQTAGTAMSAARATAAGTAMSAARAASAGVCRGAARSAAA